MSCQDTEIWRMLVHYRVRGNNVQLVKTVTDPATKRVRSEPVGSANLLTGELNDKAKEYLSAEEVALVSSWIAQKQEIKAKQKELDALTLPITINNVVDWIKNADEEKVRSISDDIGFAMSELRQAINRKLNIQPAAARRV